MFRNGMYNRVVDQGIIDLSLFVYVIAYKRPTVADCCFLLPWTSSEIKTDYKTPSLDET